MTGFTNGKGPCVFGVLSAGISAYRTASNAADARPRTGERAGSRDDRAAQCSAGCRAPEGDLGKGRSNASYFQGRPRDNFRAFREPTKNELKALAVVTRGPAKIPAFLKRPQDRDRTLEEFKATAATVQKVSASEQCMKFRCRGGSHYSFRKKNSGCQGGRPSVSGREYSRAGRASAVIFAGWAPFHSRSGAVGIRA